MSVRFFQLGRRMAAAEAELLASLDRFKGEVISDHRERIIRKAAESLVASVDEAMDLLNPARLGVEDPPRPIWVPGVDHEETVADHEETVAESGPLSGVHEIKTEAELATAILQGRPAATSDAWNHCPHGIEWGGCAVCMKAAEAASYGATGAGARYPQPAEGLPHELTKEDVANAAAELVAELVAERETDLADLIQPDPTCSHGEAPEACQVCLDAEGGGPL